MLAPLGVKQVKAPLLLPGLVRPSIIRSRLALRIGPAALCHICWPHNPLIFLGLEYPTYSLVEVGYVDRSRESHSQAIMYVCWNLQSKECVQSVYRKVVTYSIQIFSSWFFNFICTLAARQIPAVRSMSSVMGERFTQMLLQYTVIFFLGVATVSFMCFLAVFWLVVVLLLGHP